jgi:hypothetical protein
MGPGDFLEPQETEHPDYCECRECRWWRKINADTDDDDD